MVAEAPESALELLQEFTEFRQAASRLETAYRALETRARHVDHELARANEALDRMGGLAELALGIAHEIRNPLNGVAGFAKMLRRDPHSEKAPVWAGRIEEGVRRVDRIVRDLLAFAQSDRTELIERRFGEWLREARTHVAGVELVVEAEHISVRGTVGVLETVLANLIRNAAEAGAKKIVTRAERTKDRVRIIVEDDGPGVSGDVLPRLFDPFVGTKPGGSGLGLAFCARALRAMGGAIRLAETPSGARFELELSP